MRSPDGAGPDPGTPRSGPSHDDLLAAAKRIVAELTGRVGGGLLRVGVSVPAGVGGADVRQRLESMVRLRLLHTDGPVGGWRIEAAPDGGADLVDLVWVQDSDRVVPTAVTSGAGGAGVGEGPQVDPPAATATDGPTWYGRSLAEATAVLQAVGATERDDLLAQAGRLRVESGMRVDEALVGEVDRIVAAYLWSEGATDDGARSLLQLAAFGRRGMRLSAAAGGIEIEFRGTRLVWKVGAPEIIGDYLVKFDVGSDSGNASKGTFKLIAESSVGGGFRVEMVTPPMTMLYGEKGWVDKKAVFAAIDDIVARIEAIPLGGSRSITDMFPASEGFQVHPGSANVEIQRTLGKVWPNLYVQHTVGVPLEAVFPFLRWVAEQPLQHPDVPIRAAAMRILQDGLDFGVEIAEMFHGDDVSNELRRPGLARIVAGYITAMYFTPGAARIHLHERKDVLIKHYLLAASRNHPFHLRRELPVEVQLFLETYAPQIRDRFVKFYTARNPAFVARLVQASDEDAFDLLDSPQLDAGHSVGESIDNALLSHPPKVINPEEALGIGTWMGEPDSYRGRLGDPVLMLLEMRAFGEYNPRDRVGFVRDYERLETKLRQLHREILRFRAADAQAEDGAGRDAGLLVRDVVGQLQSMGVTSEEEVASAALVSGPEVSVGAYRVLKAVRWAVLELLLRWRARPGVVELSGLHSVLGRIPEADRERVLLAAVGGFQTRLDGPARAAVRSVVTGGVGVSEAVLAAVRSRFPDAQIVAAAAQALPDHLFGPVVADDYLAFPTAKAPGFVFTELVDALTGVAPAQGVSTAQSLSALAERIGVWHGLGAAERLRRLGRSRAENARVERRMLLDVARLTARVFRVDGLTEARMVLMRRLMRARVPDDGPPLTEWGQLVDLVRQVRGDPGWGPAGAQPGAVVAPVVVAHVRLLLEAVTPAKTARAGNKLRRQVRVLDLQRVWAGQVQAGLQMSAPWQLSEVSSRVWWWAPTGTDPPPHQLAAAERAVWAYRCGRPVLAYPAGPNGMPLGSDGQPLAATPQNAAAMGRAVQALVDRHPPLLGAGELVLMPVNLQPGPARLGWFIGEMAQLDIDVLRVEPSGVLSIGPRINEPRRVSDAIDTLLAVDGWPQVRTLLDRHDYLLESPELLESLIGRHRRDPGNDRLASLVGVVALGQHWRAFADGYLAANGARDRRWLLINHLGDSDWSDPETGAVGGIGLLVRGAANRGLVDGADVAVIRMLSAIRSGDRPPAAPALTVLGQIASSERADWARVWSDGIQRVADLWPLLRQDLLDLRRSIVLEAWLAADDWSESRTLLDRYSGVLLSAETHWNLDLSDPDDPYYPRRSVHASVVALGLRGLTGPAYDHLINLAYDYLTAPDAGRRRGLVVRSLPDADPELLSHLVQLGWGVADPTPGDHVDWTVMRMLRELLSGSPAQVEEVSLQRGLSRLAADDRADWLRTWRAAIGALAQNRPASRQQLNDLADTIGRVAAQAASAPGVSAPGSAVSGSASPAQAEPLPAWHGLLRLADARVAGLVWRFGQERLARLGAGASPAEVVDVLNEVAVEAGWWLGMTSIRVVASAGRPGDGFDRLSWSASIGVAKPPGEVLAALVEAVARSEQLYRLVTGVRDRPPTPEQLLRRLEWAAGHEPPAEWSVERQRMWRDWFGGLGDGAGGDARRGEASLSVRRSADAVVRAAQDAAAVASAGTGMDAAVVWGADVDADTRAVKVRAEAAWRVWQALQAAARQPGLTGALYGGLQGRERLALRAYQDAWSAYAGGSTEVQVAAARRLFGPVAAAADSSDTAGGARPVRPLVWETIPVRTGAGEERVPGWYLDVGSFVGVDPDSGAIVAEYWRASSGVWLPRLRGGSRGKEGEVGRRGHKPGRTLSPGTKVGEIPEVLNVQMDGMNGTIPEVATEKAKRHDDEKVGADPAEVDRRFDELTGRLADEDAGGRTAAQVFADVAGFTLDPEYSDVTFDPGPLFGIGMQVTEGIPPEALLAMYEAIPGSPGLAPPHDLGAAVRFGRGLAEELTGVPVPRTGFGPTVTLAGYLAMLYTVFAPVVEASALSTEPKFFSEAVPRTGLERMFAALPRELQLRLEANRPLIERRLAESYIANSPNSVRALNRKWGAVTPDRLLHNRLEHFSLPAFSLSEYIAAGLTARPATVLSHQEVWGIHAALPDVDDNEGNLKRVPLFVFELRNIGGSRASGRWRVVEAWLGRMSRRWYRDVVSLRTVLGARFASRVDVDRVVVELRAQASGVAGDDDAAGELRRALEGAAVVFERLRGASPHVLDVSVLFGRGSVGEGLTVGAAQSLVRSVLESVHIRLDAATRADITVVDVSFMQLPDDVVELLGRWFPNAKVVTATGTEAARPRLQPSDWYTGANTAPEWVDIARLDGQLARLAGHHGGLVGLAAAIGVAPGPEAEQAVRDVAYLAAAVYGDLDLARLVALRRLTDLMPGRPAVLWDELEAIVRAVSGDDPAAEPRPVHPSQVRLLADMIQALNADLTLTDVMEMAQWDGWLAALRWTVPADEHTVRRGWSIRPLWERLRQLAQAAGGMRVLAERVVGPGTDEHSVLALFDAAHAASTGFNSTDFTEAQLVAAHRTLDVAASIPASKRGWAGLEKLTRHLLGSVYVRPDPELFVDEQVGQFVELVAAMNQAVSLRDLHRQVTGIDAPIGPADQLVAARHKLLRFSYVKGGHTHYSALRSALGVRDEWTPAEEQSFWDVVELVHAGFDVTADFRWASPEQVVAMRDLLFPMHDGRLRPPSTADQTVVRRLLALADGYVDADGYPLRGLVRALFGEPAGSDWTPPSRVFQLLGELARALGAGVTLEDLHRQIAGIDAPVHVSAAELVGLRRARLVPDAMAGVGALGVRRRPGLSALWRRVVRASTSPDEAAVVADVHEVAFQVFGPGRPSVAQLEAVRRLLYAPLYGRGSRSRLRSFADVDALALRVRGAHRPRPAEVGAHVADVRQLVAAVVAAKAARGLLWVRVEDLEAFWQPPEAMAGPAVGASGSVAAAGSPPGGAGLPGSGVTGTGPPPAPALPAAPDGVGAGVGGGRARLAVLEAEFGVAGAGLLLDDAAAVVRRVGLGVAEDEDLAVRYPVVAGRGVARHGLSPAAEVGLVVGDSPVLLDVAEALRVDYGEAVAVARAYSVSVRGAGAVEPAELAPGPNRVSDAARGVVAGLGRYAAWTPPDGDCWFSAVLRAARDVPNPPPRIAALASLTVMGLRRLLGGQLDGDDVQRTRLRALARDPADWDAFRGVLEQERQWTHPVFDGFLELAPQLLGIRIHVINLDGSERVHGPAGAAELFVLRTSNHYLPLLRRPGGASSGVSAPGAGVGGALLAPPEVVLSGDVGEFGSVLGLLDAGVLPAYRAEVELWSEQLSDPDRRLGALIDLDKWLSRRVGLSAAAGIVFGEVGGFDPVSGLVTVPEGLIDPHELGSALLHEMVHREQTHLMWREVLGRLRSGTTGDELAVEVGTADVAAAAAAVKAGPLLAGSLQSAAAARWQADAGAWREAFARARAAYGVWRRARDAARAQGLDEVRRAGLVAAEWEAERVYGRVWWEYARLSPEKVGFAAQVSYASKALGGMRSADGGGPVPGPPRSGPSHADLLAAAAEIVDELVGGVGGGVLRVGVSVPAGVDGADVRQRLETMVRLRLLQADGPVGGWRIEAARDGGAKLVDLVWVQDPDRVVPEAATASGAGAGRVGLARVRRWTRRPGPRRRLRGMGRAWPRPGGCWRSWRCRSGRGCWRGRHGCGWSRGWG